MKLDDSRRSDNVEDDRGSSGMGRRGAGEFLHAGGE
jgi:predicted metalloprotease